MNLNPGIPIYRTGLQFNVSRLVDDFHRGLTLWPATDKWNRTLLNITKPEHLDDQHAMLYGTDHPEGDWFWDHTTNEFKIEQKHFTGYCDWVKGMYIHQVSQHVTKWIKDNFNLKVGRNRFVTLRPHTCLPLHTDPDSDLRFHVPLITNSKCFFFVDQKAYRQDKVPNNKVLQMDRPGALYILNVHQAHTVINASDTDRTHIIWDAY
jgi:hypothetical protein